jgi:hypothetical protein
MAATPQTKSAVVNLATQLIAGTNKHLTSMTQVTLVGGSLTPAQITSQLQEIVTLRSDVDTAKASVKAKLAVEQADMPALRTLMSALVSFVKAAFGNAPDVLADFGLSPTTRTPLTAQAKVAAAAKRTATRAARHTMGSQQKKSVTGNVTGIVVTPVTSAAPVATTPASPSAPANGVVATAGSTPHP